MGHWALGIGYPYPAGSATLRERLRRTQYGSAQGEWALMILPCPVSLSSLRSASN